jgi:hypothetical protein
LRENSWQGFAPADRPGHSGVDCNASVFAARSIAGFDASQAENSKGKLLNQVRFICINKPFVSRQND